MAPRPPCRAADPAWYHALAGLAPVALLLVAACGGAPVRAEPVAVARVAAGPVAVLQTGTLAGDAVLRRRAEAIQRDDPALPGLLARLHATLDASGGVGLAAPQIGESRRVALVRLGTRPAGVKRVQVLINPVVEWLSPETDEDYEACLSYAGGGALVRRARSLRIRTDPPDPAAPAEVLTLHDWDARIAQHELDHLDGVLFLDKLAGPLVSMDEMRRLRDAAHRARGWLP